MNYLLIGVSMLCSVAAYSQQPEASSRFQTFPAVSSHITRYKQDYELKDYSFVNRDSTVLNQLDLEDLESQRPNSGTMEITDPNTGLVIILYSRKYQLSIVNPEKSEKL